MPASASSLELTDAYRERLARIRRSTIGALSRLWVLDLEDLDASFLAWLALADRLLTATQADAVRSTDAYAAAFIGTELGRPAVAPLGLAGSGIVGTATDGRPLRELLRPSVFTVKAAIGAGRSFAEASSLGQARALRASTTELDRAGDRALDLAIEEHDAITGWRRVASGGACGACLASMTGAVQSTARVLERHPHCRCTKEPVVDGAPDRIERPTGRELFEQMTPAEQNRLFAGRGGAEKAELLRTGKVDFEDLYSETRFSLPGSTGGRANRADVIVTEASLAELRRKAGVAKPTRAKPRRRDRFDAEKWATPERDWDDWADSPIGKIISGIG